MKIGISLKDKCLGYLEEVENGYIFYADVKEIAYCKIQYPIEMLMFNIPEKMVVKMSELPAVCREYLQGADRQDIIERANILSDDSDFVKLYKIASINPEVINFKIFVK